MASANPPVELQALIKSVDTRAPSADPLDRLSTAVAVSEDLNGIADALLDHYVELARNAGLPWSAIGGALGVSKQAAQQRFVATGEVLFQRFTDRSRKVLVLAEQEARERHHSWLGVEHILIGLMREGTGVAGVVLSELGLELEAVRDKIRGHVGDDPESAPSGSPSYSPRAKRLIGDLVVKEAMQLGHNYVGTEHILLAICRQPDSVGALVLQEVLGKDAAKRVPTAVIEKLKGYRPKA